MECDQFPFQKQYRLTHEAEFKHVYHNGKRVTVGPLLIYSLKNDLGNSRLGLSIPKRVGNAVKRNAIKRRCREAFRLHGDLIQASIDIVINVRPHTLLSTQEYSTFISDGTD